MLLSKIEANYNQKLLTLNMVFASHLSRNQLILAGWKIWA